MSTTPRAAALVGSMVEALRQPANKSRWTCFHPIHLPPVATLMALALFALFALAQRVDAAVEVPSFYTDVYTMPCCSVLTASSAQGACDLPNGPGVLQFKDIGPNKDRTPKCALYGSPYSANGCPLNGCFFQDEPTPRATVVSGRACPYFAYKYAGTCLASVDLRKDPCHASGNPIYQGSGLKRQYETDLVTDTLAFRRVYASYPWQYDGPLGRGWESNFHSKSIETVSMTAARGDSKSYRYALVNGIRKPDADVADRLVELKDGNGVRTGWDYYDAVSEDVEHYDATGLLLSITGRNGRIITLNYAGGLLASVVDPFGRALTFTYDTLGRLTRLTDPLGGAYDYVYDAQFNLASVTYPADAQGVRKTRTYHYENGAFANALTGITDENGWRFATFVYDGQGRATETKHFAAAGVEVDKYTHNYTSPFATTVVTDPLGTQRTYTFQTVLGTVRQTSASQPCAACGSTSSTLTYDAYGNTVSRTDFNNKKVCYAYDLTRNLETARVEGILSSESCTTVLATPPNRPDVRKTTTTWNATYRLPASIIEPVAGGSRATGFAYDASGNLTQKAITGPKNDGSGGSTTRTWTWTYTTLGRVLTATDPNGSVMTYTYYADNDADLGKRGNVATIINPLGHVTQFTTYDANARALTLVDPNGVTTTLAYDARGRLTSRNVAGETTSYSYDGVGQLTGVTLPDGSTLAYTYDGAHRLTQIEDGLGNKIVYTLDAVGNRIQEQRFDPGTNLARARSRTFDALNRQQQELGALGQATTYAYDGNGNATTVTDPLTHATGNTYDALNRLTQVLDPASGTTKYEYDPAHNLTKVTDPRNNATTYTYDGLNNQIKLVSPDTGTTTSTFDLAGNVLIRTDARGVTATYTYDSLNRVTQAVYSKSGTPSETQTYSYDSGANGTGRRIALVDPATTTSWTYTPQGRVASKTQTVASLTQTLTYGYNAAGQLTQVTTPSGQQIGYTYANNRVAGISVNGTTLLSSGVADPFGPIAAWRWGNGLFTLRDYDTDGRLAVWEFRNGASVLRNDLSFDAASRISAIADPNAPASGGSYQYDALDRLTVAQRGNPVTVTQQFGYDTMGNRLNQTVGASVTNYTYATSSNRLLALSGATSRGYTYDGAGNPMVIGGLTYIYNNANRRVAVQNGGAMVANYQVNALGQRVQKTVGTATTAFVYDEQGHLIGEYDGSGNLIQETVWLEDLPVATLRPNGTGNPVPIAVYYVHADHLGSPRAVTRPSDNVMLWRWDNVDPFGANAANEDPSGQGTFSYNLRFPGQYYDAETGLHYNYFRDYDPSVGRYVESDPIGLQGGLNTYGYVLNNPLLMSDTSGLDPWRGDVPVAFFCSRPLAVGNAFSSASSAAYAVTNSTGHSFLCLSTGNCYGQGPTGAPIFTSPGHDPGDTWATTRACSPVPRPSPCFADCIEEEGKKPRPNYRYPGNSSSVGGSAIDCRTWANEVISTCRQRCGQ